MMCDDVWMIATFTLLIGIFIGLMLRVNTK